MVSNTIPLDKSSNRPSILGMFQLAPHCLREKVENALQFLLFSICYDDFKSFCCQHSFCDTLKIFFIPMKQLQPFAKKVVFQFFQIIFYRKLLQTVLRERLRTRAAVGIAFPSPSPRHPHRIPVGIPMGSLYPHRRRPNIDSFNMRKKGIVVTKLYV